MSVDAYAGIDPARKRCCAVGEADGSGSYHSNSDPAHTASMAYEYGKAMLAARVKP